MKEKRKMSLVQIDDQINKLSTIDTITRSDVTSDG
jgi:hypothetical protein